MNILATWRITRLLGVDYGERGAFGIFDKIREYVYAQAKAEYISNTGVAPKTMDGISQRNNKIWANIWDALLCQYCLSVWIGMALAIVTRQNVLWGLAYSAASLMFGRIFERIEA